MDFDVYSIGGGARARLERLEQGGDRGGGALVLNDKALTTVNQTNILLQGGVRLLLWFDWFLAVHAVHLKWGFRGENRASHRRSLINVQPSMFVPFPCAGHSERNNIKIYGNEARGSSRGEGVHREPSQAFANNMLKMVMTALLPSSQASVLSSHPVTRSKATKSPKRLLILIF